MEIGYFSSFFCVGVLGGWFTTVVLFYYTNIYLLYVMSVDESLPNQVYLLRFHSWNLFKEGGFVFIANVMRVSLLFFFFHLFFCFVFVFFPLL